MMPFLSELKRRKVFRVAVVYGATAFAVVQAADAMLPRLGVPDWAMSLIVVLVVLGFPVALVMAWALELTPDGMRVTGAASQARDGEPPPPLLGRRTLIVSTLLVVLGVGMGAGWFLRPPSPPAVEAGDDSRAADASGAAAASALSGPAKSIAVLPFVNLSPDPDNEYLADGLSEEILNALVRTPDLQVAARTSSFAYKGSTASAPEIAGELGVAHILEGSVRRSGERIRVTTQLIRAEDGFHLWSQNYDRDYGEVIALQEELALAIAHALQTAMDPEALGAMQRAGTRSTAAYEAYMRGLALRQRANETGRYELHDESLAGFEEALSLDPQFSDAHFRAAQYWNSFLLLVQGRGRDLSRTSYAEAMSLYRERLEAARTTARDDVWRLRFEALLAASWLRLREAQRLMRRVVEEHPNDMEALEALAIWSIHIGDLAVARDVTEQRASTALLGGTPPAVHMLFAHAPERAAELAREAVARHPDHMEILYQTHRVLLWVGDAEGASRLAARLTLPGENEERAAMVAIRQACAEGDTGRAEAVFRTLSFGDENLGNHWILLKLLGRDAEADALLDRLDRPETLYSLSAWLIYPYFDVTLYPQLAAVLAAQGVERPPLAFEPYRCAPA